MECTIISNKPLIDTMGVIYPLCISFNITLEMFGEVLGGTYDFLLLSGILFVQNMKNVIQRKMVLVIIV